MQTQSQTQGVTGHEAAERRLTDHGRAFAEEVARRHGVGAGAVETLLVALRRGGGGQAQFSHPDLGGMGQWSRHGMIMVGDMFNSALKARVDALCTELSGHVEERDLFVPEARSSWHGSGRAGANEAWWPEGCGTPSSSGAANDVRYAFFPQTRRLAILHGGEVEVFDTGEHRIHGVSSQQQNGSHDLTFTSQHGIVRLHELSPVEAPGRSSGAERPSARAASHPAPASTPRAADPAPAQAVSASGDDDVFAKIERLHALQQKGILSEAEFAEKKKELLARL